jgi:hypothetical protein
MATMAEKLAIFENVLYYWMEGNKCVPNSP